MTTPLKAARERVERDLGDAAIPLRTSDLRLILAALDEQEWRPIETAPRDGTRFDTWQISGGWQGRVIDCWIAGDDYPQWRGRVLSTDDIQMVTGPDDDAMFWRPIPAAPEPEEPQAQPHMLYLSGEPTAPEPATVEEPTTGGIEFGYLGKKAALDEALPAPPVEVKG